MEIKKSYKLHLDVVNFYLFFYSKVDIAFLVKKTFTLKTKPHVLRVSSKQPNGRIQQTLLSRIRIRKDNSEPDPDPQPWITSV